MNTTSYLIAFGTFGNPNGFKQSFFAGAVNESFVKNVKTFDLNTNAIKLFTQSKLYAIRKEHVNGQNIVSYTVYSHAKEQHSERSGTFIGSGIMLARGIAAENIIINQLNEFHEDLVSKNVQNDIIRVTHSDQFSVSKPKDFAKLVFNAKPVADIDFTRYTNRSLVVYSEIKPDKLARLLHRSLDLLNVYDTIYFTASSEVAEFVHQKGIFLLVQMDGFEEEIRKLEQEKKKKIEALITQLEQEKYKLENEKHKQNEEHKTQIAYNERMHTENGKKIQEQKHDLEQRNKSYADFSKKIDGLINQLKLQGRPEEVRQRFNDGMQQLAALNGRNKPEMLQRITQANTGGPVQPNYQPVWSDAPQEYHKSQVSKPKKSSGVYGVVALTLLLLWVGTLVYFLFFTRSETEALGGPTSGAITADTLPVVQPEPAPVNPPVVMALNTEPNSKLNENDYRLVAKKLRYDMVADSVVAIIFNKNPTDIKNAYSAQADAYKKLLIDSNQSCFEDREGVVRFVKDTLKHIPSFKAAQ